MTQERLSPFTLLVAECGYRLDLNDLDHVYVNLQVMCGEDHPEVATCDCNIALMLHVFKQYESSLKFLENSLRVFEK